MKTATFIIATLFLPVSVPSHGQEPLPAKAFPPPSFVLHDSSVKEEKPHVVLGPPVAGSDGKTTGTFAVYGGSSNIHVSGLSFSGDGKLLAVGSTPGNVDIWDVETRKKLRSLKTGTTVALTLDGRLLAADGKGIEFWDVLSGKLLKTIKWKGDIIRQMAFDRTGTLLLVVRTEGRRRFLMLQAVNALPPLPTRGKRNSLAMAR